MAHKSSYTKHLHYRLVVDFDTVFYTEWYWEFTLETNLEYNIIYSMIQHRRKQKNGLIISTYPDNKVYGANMGPTWVLSAPGGPHVGHMNIVIWDHLQ